MSNTEPEFFHIEVREGKFYFGMNWRDINTLKEAFYSGLTDERIGKDQRQAIVGAISDAMIAIIEKENPEVMDISGLLKSQNTSNTMGIGDKEDF